MCGLNNSLGTFTNYNTFLKKTRNSTFKKLVNKFGGKKSGFSAVNFLLFFVWRNFKLLGWVSHIMYNSLTKFSKEKGINILGIIITSKDYC